jgi:hypothetical protein
MAAAVPGHRQLRAGPHADLVGPFLCPASRLAELRAELQREDLLELGVIVDTGIDEVVNAVAGVAADDRLQLVMVEVPVPQGTDLAAGAARVLPQAPPEVRLYVELPRSVGWQGALDVLAAAGQGAKLRTGGLRADLFPTDEELAAFIGACVERAVPFKCTAGLHHAVRHTDPVSGFRHHGFLNIVVATARAVAGSSVREALAEARPDRLAAEAAAIDPPLAAATRAHFVSYGSCSIDEPVCDLRLLGLLP